MAGKLCAPGKGPISELLQRKLLTFCSGRGMMVCGFENSTVR